MKLCWLRVCYLLAISILTGQLTSSSSPPTALQEKNLNRPPCHRGIMSLFHWCEQSDCADKCTCLSTKVCKQICGQDECNLLNCSTSQTCFQSVLLSDYTSGVPTVKKMLSYSPITQQDCSSGNCKLMKAVRYENQYTRTFQSCSEGNCDHLYSKSDHTKQFCGNCKRMTCTGEHAKNCTQLCVLGTCENMFCNAKHCEQLCAHESTCNLTCGPNTVTCDQKCSHGSSCTMNCSAKTCSQSCVESKSCVKNMLRSTQRTVTTTNTTTYIPSRTKTKTISPTRISSVNIKTFKLPTTRLPSILKNTRSHAPTIAIFPSTSVLISLSSTCLLLTILAVIVLL